MAADIDPDTGFAYGVAQRPGAPFPEKSNIPETHAYLEESDGKSTAFADDVVPKSEDAVLEEPGDHETPFSEQPEVDAKETAQVSEGVSVQSQENDKPAEEPAPKRTTRRGKAAEADSDASKEEA